jgi:hypothetical protein
VLTATKGGGSGVIVRMGMSDSSGNLGYNGDGTSYLLFSGVQINPGSVQVYAATSGSIYQAPRFDYDPTTREYKGLLLEPTSINLCNYSEDYSNAVWTKTNVSRTVSQASPDSYTGATLLTENLFTGTNKYCIERSIIVSGTTGTGNAGVHTASVFLKAPSSSSRRYVAVQLADGQTPSAGRFTAVVDLQEGLITAQGVTAGSTSTPSNTEASIQAYRDGWYRVSVTMNITTSPAYISILLSNISTLFGGANQPQYTASSGSPLGILVWGVQLEGSYSTANITASAASSYIPTGTGSVTRVKDTLELADITPMQWNNTEGTFLFDAFVYEKNRSSYPTVWGLYNASNIRVIRNKLSNVSFTPRVYIDTWTSTPSLIVDANIPRTTNKKNTKFAFALRNTGQNFTGSVNGDPVSAFSNTGTLGTVAKLRFLLDPSSDDSEYFPVHLRQLKYWPYAFSDSQLRVLSDLNVLPTLELDFTNNSLDSRLTFGRLSNATFINSQGLVEYAAANEFLNTAWITSTTPTGWNIGFGTGTTTWNNNGTVTMDTGPSSTRPMINASSMTVAIGIPHTFGYRVVSVSGSPIVATVIHSGVVGETYAINGVTQPSSTVVVAGDIVSCTFTPTASPVAPRMGPGSQAGMTNTSMTITQPQINRGTTLQPYLANSSTSVGNYNTPRFDYDPTTLQPRGLLIEGSASNYGTHSESFATSGSGTLWTYSELDKNATLAQGPSGANDAAQFNERTTTTIHRISQFVSAAAGAVTISVWAKAIDPATPRRLYMNAIGFMGCGALFDLDPNVQTGASGTAVNVAGSAANRAGTWVKYPNGWYRCSIVGTYNTGQTLYLQVNRASSTVATDDTYSGSTANGLMLYGFQTELGSGASSYIPTGASQGSRAADNCYADSISSWYTQGSGTMLFFGRPTVPSFRTMLNFSVGTNVPRIQMYGIASTDVNCYLENPSGTGANIVVPSGTLVNGTAFKSAWAFETGNHAACINAGTVATASTSSPAVPSSGITRLNIGMRYDGFNQFNGHVISAKYWPIRLTNATLQAITTL